MKKNVFKSVLMAISLLTLCAFIYCSCTDPDSTDKDEINVGNNVTVNGNNSVYVYNLNGIAQYVYDSFGRVSEIITRDPITFNPYIVDSDSDTCKYVYNDDGILESLVYFGRTFYSSDKDENGRTVKAICGDKNGDIYVDISYNSNGVIVQETFYENGVQVLKTPLMPMLVRLPQNIQTLVP